MSPQRIPISGRTGLLAILADPVEQARAPSLVNAALAARGCDAILIPMHVRADDAAGLHPGMLAAEVVIHPETTPFLAEAAQRGCAVHYGKPMLEAQIDLMLDFMRP
jgi:shikimate 5-dehydrogenase